MKNLMKLMNLLLLVALITTASCDNEEPVALAADIQKNEEPEAQAQTQSESETMPDPATTSFNITIKNVVQYLNAVVFNTHNNATEPGPIPDPGCFYAINFKAVPGAKLSFATMSAASNDWFFAPSGSGIALFDNGMPVTGDVTDQVYLWDGGVEATDPNTFATAPGGGEAGDPDPDDTVRIVETNVTALIQAKLEYDEASKYFTLKLINVRGAAAATNPIIITPGIVVLHAQDDPMFTEGEPDRGHGLANIALMGNPGPLYEWLTESCATGPLRMSSSFTVFAPGVVYAFNSESDPVFMQGEAAVAGSGLEEISEDGNNGVMFDYITNDLMLPAAKSNEAMPIGPGGSLTFTLEVPEGYKLGYNTMFVFSNDWFVAHDNYGYPLFHEDGTPVNGTEATQGTYLFDAGTEVDQPVGFGPDQAPFQSGPNTGAADENNLVRRVMEIDDVQFGKGPIMSEAGVAGHPDPRGGYNLVEVTIESN